MFDSLAVFYLSIENDRSRVVLWAVVFLDLNSIIF